MKMAVRFIFHKLTFIFAILCGVSSSCPGKDGGPLRLEKEIPLPGVEGRIDHLSADTNGQRLFVAALGNGSIEVIDVRRGERIGEIKGLQEPQGVYYDSKTGRLFVATARDGKLRIYDGNALTLQVTVELGSDADNVRYDQQTGDVWVGYGYGGLAIINSAGQRAGSIALGSHPESFLFEDTGDRVFVNVPRQFGVAVVDRKKRGVVAKWGLGGPLANYPMALDNGNKRLFVGCRVPARLVVLDTNSGRIVATLPIVGDTDDVFYDASKQQVYVIGGEGAVEVFRQRGADHYESVGKTPTASGARTGFFVPNSGRLFVAVPHRGSQMARVLVYVVDKS
jgi:DNA-binding beta-propeller fold protein YncE